MKYYIFKNDANIPLLGIEGEPDQALCPTKPELEFWAELEKLRKQNSILQSKIKSIEKGIKQILEDTQL